MKFVRLQMGNENGIELLCTVKWDRLRRVIICQDWPTLTSYSDDVNDGSSSSRSSVVVMTTVPSEKTRIKNRTRSNKESPGKKISTIQSVHQFLLSISPHLLNLFGAFHLFLFSSALIQLVQLPLCHTSQLSIHPHPFQSHLHHSQPLPSNSRATPEQLQSNFRATSE